jgi:hypothetical protein
MKRAPFDFDRRTAAMQRCMIELQSALSDDPCNGSAHPIALLDLPNL